tara:strand:- start:4793 stop:6208 length:1416 start_codon:yes stop_codon:yes gene_type:complete
MAANLASFASILKEFYLGPIQDQLNEETLICDMFEKASVDWSGRLVWIPVHVARNANVAFVAEGGGLPGPALGVVGGAAGSQQGYANLIVNAEFLYGRFQITGPAMASAGKGGANAFVGWVDGEMNRLVNDIKNQCNRAATSGGQCIGFVTASAQVAAAGTVQALYDGDPAKLALAVLSGAAAGVNVADLIRMDTYASIIGAGAGLTIAAGGTPGTITVTESGGAAGTLNFVVDPAGGAVPCALVLNAGANAGAAPQSFLNEPVGIYGNLGLPGTGAAGTELSWFGIDRTTATGAPAGTNALQCGDGQPVPLSNALTTVVAAAAPVRVNINMQQMQTMVDRITLASDEEIDTLLCSPLQRTRLAATLQTNFNFNTDKSGGGGGTADGGYTGFAFAGIPVKTSRHVDNGLMIGLHTKAWKMLELQSGQFADEDGNVLSRVGVADAYEGFYKWYYNVTCIRPNANGFIAGLAL